MQQRQEKLRARERMPQAGQGVALNRALSPDRRLSALSVLSVPGQGEDSEAGAE